MKTYCRAAYCEKKKTDDDEPKTRKMYSKPKEILIKYKIYVLLIYFGIFYNSH